MSDSRPQQRLVVGDVSLTMGLVMNPHEEAIDDQYDHASQVPATAAGLFLPSSVGGLQALQQDMRARVPGAVLDAAVQAAFQQLVPPGLRAAIHVLAEWDARWFADLDKPSFFAEAGAVRSHGDRAFEVACVGTVQPQGDGALPAFAQTLRRHAWTLGPLGLAGRRRWAGVLVRLAGRDPATGLYARVAQVALVDPCKDCRDAAEGERALRRLEHALLQAGLTFGDGSDNDDVRPGSAAWRRAAWRRTNLWVPRQADADDGSCGPRYYVLAKTLFARLTALWEAKQAGGGHRAAGARGEDAKEPPYDEAALWATPLSGWFDHEATRWEMVGHHAARAVRDAHYQARVTAEVVRTQHDGSMPAPAALRLPPAPAYEAMPAPPASLFAPEVVPSAVRNRPTTTTPATPFGYAPAGWPSAAGLRPRRQATSTPSGITSDQSQGTTTTTTTDAAALFDPPFPRSSSSSSPVTRRTTAGQKRRRRASDAAVPPHPRDRQKRRRCCCCRVRARDRPAPPNGYPVYPDRPLDAWDWRCVRWALTDPGEARMLNMHAAHWREEQAADRVRREDEGSDVEMEDGGGNDEDDDDDDDDGDDGNGHGHGHDQDHGGEGAAHGSHDEDPPSSPDGRRDEDGNQASNHGRRRRGRGHHDHNDGEEAREETLSLDDQLRRLVDRAARATGESAQVLLARHQMEALERDWARDRARGMRMQAPERPRLHHREPTDPPPAAAAAAEAAQPWEEEETEEGRQPPFRAYIDAEGRPRIHNTPMEMHVGRLMRGE